ncbi:MAG: septum formation inhibitor Maf [Sulfurimonas sp.]|jgi:septum formation protein|nr:septum formation inhibitor Maf [Sulfurimonadaceae bacterium]
MLLLASSSQTRAKLLSEAGFAYVQKGVDFDEDSIVAKGAKNFVYQATLGKYNEAIKRFGYEDMPLLVADSVVSTKDKILRKAKNIDEARELLLLQSGSEVSILTCMIFHSKKLKLIDISATTYEFSEFDKKELDNYLLSGEWIGKAGACMVEGFCSNYIKTTKGHKSTAMGLNIEVLSRFYK